MGRTRRKFRPTNQQSHFVIPTIRLGWFRAGNVRLEEAAINDVVLRVDLGGNLKAPKVERIDDGIREDFTPQAPSNKRGIKRRAQNNNRNRRISEYDPKNGEIIRRKRLRSESASSSNTPKRAAVVSTLPTSHQSNRKRRARNSGKQYRLELPLYPNQVAPSRCFFNWEMLYKPESLCSMTLPSAAWCMNLVRSGAQGPITFSVLNKLQQKGVIFNRKTDLCTIIVKGHPVVLLGCPDTVRSIRDLEILIGIVHYIGLDDCMLVKIQDLH